MPSFRFRITAWRRGTTTLAAAAITAGSLALAVPGSAAAATGPVFPVMNTSEYPPDGVFFRNSPNDSDAIRIAGIGVYSGERVSLQCYASGTNVQRRDGGVNTIWYQATNVTRPAVAGRSNAGWINAHFVNDGTGPGQTAPGVPSCSGGSNNASGGATANPPPFDARSATDSVLFDKTMPQFTVLARLKWHGDQLDWSTDGCSVPKVKEPARSQPGGFDFRNACWRHDFGYRNYKKQSRFTEANRRRIDDNFLADMNAVCNTYSGLHAAQGVNCRNTYARAYYEAVRVCGGTPKGASCVDPILRKYPNLAIFA